MEIVDELELIRVITSPSSEEIVILALLEKDTILRFVAALKDEINGYNPQYELQSFMFDSRQQALNFADNITSMSALDLMIIMHNAENDLAPTN